MTRFHKHSVITQAILEAIRFGVDETETISRFSVIMSALPELHRSIQDKDGDEGSGLKVLSGLRLFIFPLRA